MQETRLTPLVLLTAVTIAGALLAILVGAQVNVVETELRVTDIEHEPSWSGDPLTRNVNIMLCHGVGGTNPQSGGFLVNITVNTPDWVNATHPHSVTVQPPLGPTVEAACTEPTSFEIQLVAPQGVPENQSISVTLHLRAEPETDQTGQPTTGTYATPAPTQATFHIDSVAPPQEAPEQEPEDESEDSPAIPILLVAIAALGVVAVKRRR